MSDRSQRRKRLVFDSHIEFKHVKDLPFERKHLDSDNVVSLIEDHIRTMLVPQFHQQVVGVVLLNIDDVMENAKEQAVECYCKITVKTQEEVLQEEFMIPVSLYVKHVPTKHKGYFEGIIQLRDVSDDEFKFIDQMLITKEVGIAKEVGHPNGVDWYIDNNHKAQAAMQMMKRRFKGELNITTKLQGYDHQKSRELRRVTMLYRGSRKV